MKQNQMVKISATTLNALKQMLFSSNGSVDLTSIVKDLTIGDENPDLVAINVALAFNGVTPEVDKATRYGNTSVYWRSYKKYEFVSYSLIRSMVTVKVTEVAREKDCDEWKEKELSISSMSLSSWLEEYETTPDKCIEEINEKQPVVEQPVG